MTDAATKLYTLLKQCRSCNELKPATPTYYYRKADVKSGLRAICKACSDDEAREWSAHNLEKVRAKARAYYYRERAKQGKAVKRRADHGNT